MRVPEPSSYFLDESGHGGDLASARDLDFAGQPVFALACVGRTGPWARDPITTSR